MPRTRTKGSILPESIVQAATRLFIERGFDGTSMHEIADALGVTRTTVYYCYKNKEAILVSLTDSITRVAAQLAEEAAQHKDLPPIDALRTLVSQYVGLVIDHSSQFRVVERNEERLPPKRREAARVYRCGVLGNFTSVIERGIQSGVFRPADARVAALAIIGMCNWTAWWFQPDGRKARDEVAQLLAEFAVHALTRATAGLTSRSHIGEALRELQQEIGYLEQRVTELAD